MTSKRLDKIAPTVLNAFARNPPDWAPEFNEWVKNTFGARPSSVRANAGRQYDAAVLGAVLAFNYLAINLQEVPGANAHDSTVYPSAE